MRRISKNNRNKIRKVRHQRVRAKIKGTAKRPRLSVFRGIRSMNLQLIDDENSKTLFSANTNKIKDGDTGERSGKIAKSYLAGKLLAEQAKKAKIEEVVFDRGGYKYQGRVSAAADGARDGGLKF
jgi:large subunit ribosomal protein L18